MLTKHLWDVTYDDVEGDNKLGEHTSKNTTCCKDIDSNKSSSSYGDSKGDGSKCYYEKQQDVQMEKNNEMLETIDDIAR